MSTLFFLLTWYAVGLVGALMVMWMTMQDMKVDLTMADAIFGALMAMFGPFNLIVGLVFYLFSCEWPRTERFMGRVVWRHKR